MSVCVDSELSETETFGLNVIKHRFIVVSFHCFCEEYYRKTYPIHQSIITVTCCQYSYMQSEKSDTSNSAAGTTYTANETE